MPAGGAPPPTLDEPRRCFERLLSIINERNAQVEILKMHLEQQTELCKLEADRATRAEAIAAAARAEAHNHLLQPQLERPVPSTVSPGLSPADLATLNVLPPAERDAAWLRRVFARGNDAGAPLGPHELAGMYMDAFFWTGTAASPHAIVAAVARVFPGVQLVQTECVPRFRGLVRAQVVSADPGSRDRQARPPRTERSAAAPDAYASAAEASSSSRPASPHPAAAPTAKRKRSPEPEPDPAPETATSKRVRTAQSGAVKSEDTADSRPGGRVLHDVGTSPLRLRAAADARILHVAQPARSLASIATQTMGTRKSYTDAEVQAGVCDESDDEQEVDPRDRDALIAALHALPPDLPPVRVPCDLVKSALPDRPVRIVSNLRRGQNGRDEEEQETFREDADGGTLEYLGTYVFRPVCVGYSLAVHDALERAVLDEEVRILSRLGVGDSDSEDGDFSDGA